MGQNSHFFHSQNKEGKKKKNPNLQQAVTTPPTILFHLKHEYTTRSTTGYSINVLVYQLLDLIEHLTVFLSLHESLINLFLSKFYSSHNGYQGHGLMICLKKNKLFIIIVLFQITQMYHLKKQQMITYSSTVSLKC